MLDHLMVLAKPQIVFNLVQDDNQVFKPTVKLIKL